MKIITILSQLFLIATSFNCINTSAKTSSAAKADTGFAVIELFTSEGCSSCPPADNAVANLLKEHSSNVYVLSYHVDYWDNLGWKDKFSNAAYTQTQKEYARIFKLSSIYTPQVVVNGSEQFVGSDESKLNAAVNKGLQQVLNAEISVDAKANENKTVVVNYTTGATNAKLKVALVQLNATNKIQRGENTGATLHHVNIVRDIKTIPASANGSITLSIPNGLTASECKVIAFTQNMNDNKITSAAEASIQ